MDSSYKTTSRWVFIIALAVVALIYFANQNKHEAGYVPVQTQTQRGNGPTDKVTFGQQPMHPPTTAAQQAYQDGEEHLKDGQLDAAERSFKAAATMDANSSVTWESLAVVQQLKKEFNLAEDSYRRALALDNNNGRALNGLAVLSFDRHEYNDAITQFSNLLRRFPTDSDLKASAVWGLATCYQAKGDAANAAMYFKQYLAGVTTANNAAYAQSWLAGQQQQPSQN